MGKASRRRQLTRAGDDLAIRTHRPVGSIVPIPEGAQSRDGLVRLEQAPPGEHRWVIVSTYRLSDDEALNAYRGPAAPVPLDTAHLIAVTDPLCFICERPFLEVHAVPCTGDPGR